MELPAGAVPFREVPPSVLSFKAAEGSQVEETLLLCAWGTLSRPWGLLLLCKSVQRRKDFAAGIGHPQRGHLPFRTLLPFSTGSEHISHLTEAPGLPPAWRPPTQMS